MTSSAPSFRSGTSAADTAIRPSFLRDAARRLLVALGGFGVGLAIVGWFVPQLRSWLLAPVHAALPEGARTVYMDALDPYMIGPQIALAAATFVSVPWMVWQLWLLVAPRVSDRTRRAGPALVAVASTLFYAGAAFAYWAVLPRELEGLFAFTATPGPPPMVTLSHAISLVLRRLFGGGFAFVLPGALAGALFLGRRRSGR